ncbi:MAG: hypothetical protein DMG56_17660 [Acidobacteria bacterium]|nr:MAG: hypothetical protein DMG55_19990 [Acidobacteriota bacterium]PYU59629.1 MAG: hypothetical protein DMG56_17660 [Acidobacteriota bacterium]
MNIDRFAEVKRKQKQYCQKKELYRCRNNKITRAARWSSRTILQHRLREQLLTMSKTSWPRVTNECRSASDRPILQPFLTAHDVSQLDVDEHQKPWNYHFLSFFNIKRC